MSRAQAALIGVAALVAIAASGSILQARDDRYPQRISADRFLYIHSGAAARRLTLSFNDVAADVYWIRAIQNYGGDRHAADTAHRFELLQPLLDLTTSLDPHFSIAYRFGAVFLSQAPPGGPGRPDQAIALLRKGLAADPTRWQYAHDIGYVYYWSMNDPAQAAAWLERASAMPGAPNWLKPVAARMLVQGGDRTAARAMLLELAASPEKWIRDAAELRLVQIDALDQIDRLQADVRAYVDRFKRRPSGWRDLVDADILAGTPLDPAHYPYVYDAAANVVRLSPQSPLAPLPTSLSR